MNPPSEALPEQGRKPYLPPVITVVPLVPEELFAADCAKTPSICHSRGPYVKAKS